MSEQQTINFDNGLATVKDGAVINEAKLRETRVFAKLMPHKGIKFGNAGPKDFYESNSGEFYRAELFIIGSRDQIIFDSRLWVNVSKDAKVKKSNQRKMYFVELIHPTFDPNDCEDAFQ